MTFIWTLVSKHGVVQVSDRRISRDRIPVTDEGNKTIVLKARNAIAAMSYTGYAQLEGLRSDVWTAHTIAGLPTSGTDTTDLGILRMRPLPRWLDYGQAAQAVRDGLHDLSCRNSAYRASSHTVLIAGWQWPRKGGRPRVVGTSVNKRPSSSITTVTHWAPRVWDPGRFWLVGTPMPPPFGADDIAKLHDELRPHLNNLDQCADILAASIRRGAEKWPTIGRGCMAVTLPIPQGAPAAHCRYIPGDPVDAGDWVSFDTPLVLLDDVMIAYPSRFSLVRSAADEWKQRGEVIRIGDIVTVRF